MYQDPENMDPLETVNPAQELENLEEQEDQLKDELQEVNDELQQELHLLQRQLGGEGEVHNDIF